MTPRAARVDLNADIGESSGNDEALLAWVTSASVACGFHAGDPVIMRRTIRLAAGAGVAIGAHPSFADLAGFGRQEMNIPPDDITDLVLYQLGALSAIARSEGVALQHVKPHGALYNMGARDAQVARAIARAVAAFGEPLLLVGLPGSELIAAGKREGLRVVAEGFVDRSYEPDGSLTPREREGAVISDVAVAVERAVRMVREGRVVARDGRIIPMEIDTICIHSDTPRAVELAVAVRTALSEAGISVAALSSRSD